MKKLIFYVAILGLVTVRQSFAQSQRAWEDIDLSGFHQCDTTHQKGYTLIFINKDPKLKPQTIADLKSVFWKVYPQQVKRFNKQSAKTVTVMVGNEYKGVGATWKSVVKIDQDWLANNPTDFDLLTHELMHVVQNYPYPIPDPWLTDSIADYARYTFGVDNGRAGWSLPPYSVGQSYNHTYRIGARFLVWLEKHKRKDIVDRVNQALYQGVYTKELWPKLTGNTLDELWSAYAANPMI